MDLTDPAGMPEDERMSPAEFRVVREWLGLPDSWLARHLNVSDRAIRHWQQGRYPIPDGVRLEVERLEAVTADHVTAAINALADATDPAVITYRSDEDYRAAHPEVSWPLRWHDMVLARVAQEVPGLVILYAPQDQAAPAGAKH